MDDSVTIPVNDLLHLMRSIDGQYWLTGEEKWNELKNGIHNKAAKAVHQCATRERTA